MPKPNPNPNKNPYNKFKSVNRKKPGWLIIIALLLFSSFAFSQDRQTENKSLIDSVNQIYGSDDILISGNFHIPEIRNAKGHPYLNDELWHSAKVFIKDRSFDNQELRFDIQKNEMILKTQLNNLAKVSLILNSQIIDSIHMMGTCFVSTKTFDSLDLSMDYFEAIFDGPFKLIRTYKKEFRLTDKNGEYYELRPQLYLLINDTLIRVNSKRRFLKNFPNQKSEIKRFLRQNKIRYRKASNADLIKLMNLCTQMTSRHE